MELSREQQAREQQFMHIALSEREIRAVEIIPIDVDQGEDETLGLEVGFLLNAFDVGRQVDSPQ